MTHMSSRSTIAWTIVLLAAGCAENQYTRWSRLQNSGHYQEASDSLGQCPGGDDYTALCFQWKAISALAMDRPDDAYLYGQRSLDINPLDINTVSVTLKAARMGDRVSYELSYFENLMAVLREAEDAVKAADATGEASASDASIREAVYARHGRVTLVEASRRREKVRVADEESEQLVEQAWENYASNRAVTAQLMPKPVVMPASRSATVSGGALGPPYNSGPAGAVYSASPKDPRCKPWGSIPVSCPIAACAAEGGTLRHEIEPADRDLPAIPFYKCYISGGSVWQARDLGNDMVDAGPAPGRAQPGR